MNLRLVELNEALAKEISSWQYEGIYAIYNYPQWNELCKDNWAITIAEKRKKEFYGVVNEFNYLCGYIRLQDKEEYILIGLGLNPLLCGQGLGQQLMDLLKSKCRSLYPNKKVILEVRSFNKRAINCYKRAGFKIIEKYTKTTPIGSSEFIKMELI